MKTNSYRQDVLRTAPNLSPDIYLNLGALGLAGESGEVIDLIKKTLFHGKPLDRENLKKELGDVRWYLEIILHSIDSSIEEIEQLNIEKLKKRYPEGFSVEAANAVRTEK